MLKGRGMSIWIFQVRFAIVHGPASFWDHKTLQKIMIVCVIIHNMIIEDECDKRVQCNKHIERDDHETRSCKAIC